MKFTKFAALLAVSAIALTQNTQAAPAQKAALDERGVAVISTNGNCVRTKWDGDKDICAKEAPVAAPEPAPEPEPVAEAPAPAPEPAPEPVKPAKELTKGERSIYFDFDKDILTADSQTKLDGLVDIFKSDKEVESVKIVAYADKMGTEKYNEVLAKKRADAVNAYLNEKGYLKTTPEVKWFGKSDPKTNCPDKMKRKAKIACLAEDRRAEIVVNFFEIVTPPVAEPAATPAPEATPAPAETAPELTPVPENQTQAPDANQAIDANEAAKAE
jgi:outer membrane protein OmpA-like peptidoglycan-associated protein